MKDTASFSVSGEFITNHARERWAEGAYSKAMDVLECLEGATHEQHLEILFGSKKLVGINDVDLVDDDWDPASEYWDYPSYKEGMSRGDGYQELKELRDEKAWKIAYDEWPYSRQGFVAYTHEHSSWKKVEALVGKERANHIFSQVQDDMIDRPSYLNRPVKTDTIEPESTWTPSPKEEKADPLTMMYAMAQQNLMMNAIENGTDIDSIPTVDAMMNRGSNIEIILDDHMTSASGWLLPNGNYYGCGTMEHIGLAESLLKHINGEFNGNAEQTAENRGWVKISRTGFGLYVICHKKPTKKQLNRLWDYSVLHKKDYEDLIHSLDVLPH
jgi:hypothetical protein